MLPQIEGEKRSLEVERGTFASYCDADMPNNP